MSLNSKRTAYLLALIFSNAIPVIDSLSIVYVGGGIIQYNEIVYWLLKLGNFLEQSIILIFISVLFKEKWYKCYWWCIVIQIAIGLPVVCTYQVKFTKSVDGIVLFRAVDLKSLTEYLFYIILTLIVGCFFVYIGRSINKLYKIDKISKWWFYIIYTIFAFVVFYSDKRYGTGDNNVFSKIGNIKQIIFFFTILLIVFFISINNADKKLLKLEVNLLKQQNDLQFSNYLTMQQQEAEIHKLYHDIGNHIGTIKVLLNDGDNQEAREYAEDLIKKYRDTRKKYYCSNKIINAVLSQKFRVCEENKIAYDHELRIPDNLSIKDIDLMSVFANLLDNAIESCQRNTNGDNYISLKAATVGNYFTVKVINSKISENGTSDNTLHTWKKDKSLHGYGLKILEEIVQRYEGQSEIKDNKENFSAMVMLMMEQ